MVVPDHWNEPCRKLATMLLYVIFHHVVTYGPIFVQREKPLCSTMTSSGSELLHLFLDSLLGSPRRSDSNKCDLKFNCTHSGALVSGTGSTIESVSRSLEWNVEEECGGQDKDRIVWNAPTVKRMWIVSKILDILVKAGSHLEWIFEMGQKYDLTPVVQVGSI
jgi:hypothetical protein